MNDDAWFDFVFTGSVEQIENFNRVLDLQRLTTALFGYEDQIAISASILDNGRKLALASGFEEVPDSKKFDLVMEATWFLAHDLMGLKVSGGIYYEDCDRQRFRASFDETGKLQYRSVMWVLDELSYAEVDELKAYAEKKFGRKLKS